MNANSKSSSMGTFVILIVGTTLAGIGYCVLTFWAKPVLSNARNSVNWPTVTGVITESELKTHSDSDGTTYSAAITYHYTVDENEIHGDRVWFGDNYSSSDLGQHQKVVSRYPVGDEVDVYYKPDDPFISVLEPGAVFTSYVGFATSWIVILIGFGLLLIPMSGWLKLGKSSETSVSEFSQS